MDTLMKTALADGIYVAYTDGSCRPNPGPGACAFRLFSPSGEVTEKTIISLDTKNNRAELGGVIAALMAVPEGETAIVCSDSSYVTDNFDKYLQVWIKRGWRKSNGKPVLNDDLWKKIVVLTETRTVTFHKIKAHSGDPDNERVDTLAGIGADRAGRRVIEALKRG